MRAVIALALIGIASSARGNYQPSEALKRGVRAYATGKFRDAIRTLNAVARSAGDDTSRLRALKYVAASQLAVGNRSAARDAVVELLKVDPMATFEIDRFPKRVLVLFDEVRKGLTGKVVVVCDRKDGKVEVAGRKPAPCGDFESVPIGLQIVKATTPDEPAITKNVVVHVGKTARIEFNFGPGFGFLTLSASPPDAMVTLDGNPAPKLPLSKHRVATGRHTIVVQAPGYRDKTQSIEVARGVESPLSIALEKVPFATPPKPTVVIEKKPEPRIVASPPISKARRVFAWSLVGTGVAALAAGVALQVYAVSKSAKLEAQNESATGSNSTGDMKSIETLDRAAKGFFIGAGVTALAGTIVLLVRGKASAAIAAHGMSLSVGALPTFAGAPTLGVGPRWQF